MAATDSQPGTSLQHAAAAVAPGTGAVDPGELYFLLAHALSAGPFAHLGAALAGEAAAAGLLPCRYDSAGGRHALTYDQLRQRYAHLPPTVLHDALGTLLGHAKQAAPTAAARGLTSLLDASVLGGLAVAGLPPPPRWMRPSLSGGFFSGHGPPPPQLLLLREAGGAAAGGGGGLSPAAFGRQLRHHQSVRGHRFAAYCVMYDKSGRHVITGADDCLVKARLCRAAHELLSALFHVRFHALSS
jgi:hypothetical protein